jgi:dATP pyrophosphohydrolase
MTNNIPILTNLVSVYVCKKVEGLAKFLILKRKSKYMFGLWQQVSGKIEEDETATQAAVREIKEETGLTPEKLFSADIVETFFDADYNAIRINPIFVAIVSGDVDVTLSHEHSEFKWATASEAKAHFSFYQQRMPLDVIEQEFILREPLQNLRINF